MMNHELVDAVARVAPAPPPEPGESPACVRDLVCTRVAKIPPWFTAAQALRIAALRGVDHLLVEEHGGICGSIGRNELDAVPGSQIIARMFHRARTAVGANTSLTEAQRLMAAERLACLPVIAGGMLVGTISQTDIDAHFAGSADAA